MGFGFGFGPPASLGQFNCKCNSAGIFSTAASCNHSGSTFSLFGGTQSLTVPTFSNECRGSRVVPYSATKQSDGGTLQSISAMPAYIHKSHEELRFEDYQLDCRKGGRETYFGGSYLKPFGSKQTGNSFEFDSELQAPMASTNIFASNSSQPFVIFPKTHESPALSNFSTNVNPNSSRDSNHAFFTTSSNAPELKRPVYSFPQTYPWSSRAQALAPTPAPTPAPSAFCFSSFKDHFQDFTSQDSVVSSIPAPTLNLCQSSLVPSSNSVPSNYVKFPQISTTTSTSFTLPPLTWSTAVTPLGFQAPQSGQASTSNNLSQPSQGEGSKEKACVSSCFHINVDSIEFEEEEVSELMPKLRNPEYYSEPSIEELEAKEKTEPGFCSRVKDFVIGRRDKGSIKFLGEIDIRKLDLESIVQFNDREVFVYVNDTEKQPVGKGLNGPAEITLLNVKCIGKTTGKLYTDGPQVQRYKAALIKKSAEVGVEFVSYDPVQGEWKFSVQHF